MSETVNASVPLNIRWTQEFVDDGAGGDKFYIRLTPRIQTGGRYSAGTSNIKVANLLTIIQKLKREKSNEIQRAAKYGAQQAVQGMNAEKYRAQKRQEEAASSAHLARIAEETERQNQEMPFFVSSSTRLQEAFEADYAAGKLSDKDVQFEKEEKEEEKEKEEVYYIK